MFIFIVESIIKPKFIFEQINLNDDGVSYFSSQTKQRQDLALYLINAYYE